MSALLKMKPEPKKPKTAKKSVQKNGQMSRHEVAPFIPPEVYSDTIYLYINLLPATLPISAYQRYNPLTVCNLPCVVPEIKLGQIAAKVLFPYVVIRPSDPALE